MKLVSLAPRYIGDFEKGVDYKGDVAALERSLARPRRDRRAARPVQAEPALGLGQALDLPGPGPRDQGPVPREDGRDELPRGASRRRPARARLFRRIVDFSRARYDRDKATYHVSATLPSAPPPAEVPDDVELERLYLELWSEVPPGRGSRSRAGRSSTARSARS